MTRLQALCPRLEEVYQKLIIAVPPDITASDRDQVETLARRSQICVVFTTRITECRYAALKQATEMPVTHIHYADMDRLLRWVETKPLEWQQTVERIQQVDCLLIGRTEAAFQTHPQALQQTEKIINTVFSNVLGQTVDFGSGTRGFSRQATQLVVANTLPDRWTDVEWLLVLRRAGFAVDYLMVDGMDWESADRYRPQAADPDTQRRLAQVYDEDPANWAIRVQIAGDIIQSGLDVQGGI